MEQAIQKALVYFDLFEYPLTAVELWKYAPTACRCALADIMAGLTELEARGRVEHHGGFWTLPDRAAIIITRLSRYTASERKYARAKRAVQFLKRIPSIRMVAVANTLAWNHAREGSDIDLFIVTCPGAVWKSRLLGVTPFALLGLRPRAGAERDTFCFSFFAAESALDLAPFMITPDDPYLLYWAATLASLYDPDGLLEALWEANPWIRERLPNAWQTRGAPRRRVEASSRDTRDFTPSIARVGEQCARAVQLLRLPPTLRSMMNVDGRVVITDEVLKFHVNDRREEIAERFRARCREVGVCP